MIYVLMAKNKKESVFKIGFSLNPARRIPDIQTNCPFKLALIALRPGTIKDERAYHKKLAQFNTNGEWFKDTPEVREVLGIKQVLPDIIKVWHKTHGWFKIVTFLESNKDYSFDAKMLCECLDINYWQLNTFYQNKNMNAPFRMEGVNEEDARKVSLVGSLKCGTVISHPDLFTPILGAFDQFWQGPTRVTPFNQAQYPHKKLGQYTF